MNHSMQGMTKVIPELFVMLKSTKVEIKKKHQMLMVDETTSFKKRAKGRRGTSRRTASKLLLKWRSLSLVLRLRLSASTAKGLVTGTRTAPSIWRIRRMAKWRKVYLTYMLLMCTLLVFIETPRYLILVQLLRVVTRNGNCRMNRD